MTVPVLIFPKPCPHCKVLLTFVQKMHESWLECENEKCPGLTQSDTCDDPYPFTCCYNSR